MRILIVDDHDAVRSELRAVLAAEGWSVCGEAKDGEEAVERVRYLRPDLVILDMSMPAMNGFEAAHEIRRIAPNTRIVILTMHEPANLPSILAETEADAFITKTRAVRELVSTIKHLSAKATAAQ